MTDTPTPAAQEYHRTHQLAFDTLRKEADAYNLARSPLSPIGSNPDALAHSLELRNRAIRQARTDQILSVQEISQATGLSRQTVYALTPPEPQPQTEAALQAEYELREAIRQYHADTPETNSQGLAQLLKVSTAILRADALPLHRVSEMTGWSKRDLQRLALREMLSPEDAKLPAHMQLPETAV